MKVKALSEELERNKSIQNLQKATKIFTEFITNCANKSLKLKRRYKTNKKRINLGSTKFVPIWKSNLNDLLVFREKSEKYKYYQ